MNTVTSSRDTTPETPSLKTAVPAVSLSHTFDMFAVAVRDTKGIMPHDVMLGVSIAPIPVRRAVRNGGAAKADQIARIMRDVVQGERYPMRETAAIVTAPRDSYYFHKPKSVVAMASQAGASTTVLDPDFGRDARGVMLMRRGGVIASMPLILRRGIMQAVLTRSDLILPPSTEGNFIIACDAYELLTTYEY